MVCPSCGAQIDGRGQFCAACGARVPDAAPVAAQAAPPPPPVPPYGAPPYGAPQYGAPPYGPPPYGAPQYGAPQYGTPPYGAPPYGAPPYAASTRAAASSPIGGLLALVGGAVAVVSAWLPWMTVLGTSLRPIDSTDMSDLACGYYLLIGGGIAAACGLLLLLRAGTGPSMPTLLAIGAIAGGVLVVAVEIVAYGRINDAVRGSTAYGFDFGAVVGYGLYTGIGGGVVAAIGGLLGMLNRR